ncbi:MAG: LysM peptidoglycan-binding domain-containing protein [Chloroflexi bacterium]|nr:LysM peptidoglycan-binding domain-containing protein [Chloroflexota bacterium]
MSQRFFCLVAAACALVACTSEPAPTSQAGAPPTHTPRPLLSSGDQATATLAAEPTETPEPTPTPGPIFIEYKVRAGDTLGAISARFDLSVEDLMKINGLTDPHSLQIGRVLKIRVLVEKVGPDVKILPDSEAVYGPAYKDFDLNAFLAKYPDSYLGSYSEIIEGQNRTGAEIIQLVAERFSVGPRVLLALMELRASWITASALEGNQIAFPMGLQDPGRQNLYRQAAWAANQINAGYYGKISGRLGILEFADRQRAQFAYGLNPGTAAIQNVLAKTATWDEWQTLVAPQGFRAAYEKLFGDPYQYEVKPLLPKNLQQPSLGLPIEAGKLWYFTGGPHAGWVDGSPWAAVDFAPADQAGSCWPSKYWAIAAAPGVVTASENGRVVQDLDGDGFQGTGWALLYMHLADEERVAVGAKLKANDPIGHPSCQGGAAETSHVHFARLYNGQWIPAGDTKIPLVLSGWTFSADSQEYDGAMTRGDQKRTAENQRIEEQNGITPNGAQ